MTFPTSPPLRRAPLLLTCALLLAAGPAHAVTLSIAPDQDTYTVGETVTLSVLLDYEGASVDYVYGRIEFDPSLATGTDVTTSLDGGFGIPPFPDCGTGYCDVFDHSVSGVALGVVAATVTMSADAPGEVHVVWNPAPPLAVGTPTSFTIVPEPTTAGLVGLGVAALARAARGRPAKRRP